jgi:hypothetical protein
MLSSLVSRGAALILQTAHFELRPLSEKPVKRTDCLRPAAQNQERRFLIWGSFGPSRHNRVVALRRRCWRGVWAQVGWVPLTSANSSIWVIALWRLERDRLCRSVRIEL